MLERLEAWATRPKLRETQAESAFLQTFFVETWGYGEAGRVAPDDQTLFPKWRVDGEGAGGGSGEADAALGWFRGRCDSIPQVLCEFKDIRSNLDAKQNRKGSTRSPVEQALNYVRGARRGLIGNESVQPWWALVSDMNEFRLYWWDRAPSEYLRFVVQQPPDLFTSPYDLLSKTEEARFDRFLFAKLFTRDFLISPAGRPPLLRLIDRQWAREKKLEKDFYKDYRETRERLFAAMLASNPGFTDKPTDNSVPTRSLGELLRLAQVLVDRLIFVFFCEDMGQRMRFPPQILTDHMKERSKDGLYDPNGRDIWDTVKRVFATMNTGGRLGASKVPHVNGGLFAHNPLLDSLHIPNHVFAATGQGANDASLESDRSTVLHLGARYSYASQSDAREAISLYTLGRIFEQSITELDYRTGELEGRETVSKLSKRKRNGVYYTPEWVVNLLVEETLGPWFRRERAAAGLRENGAPELEAARSYAERLTRMRLVDPACGSGAFLISAFRRVLAERLAAEREVARLAAEEAGGSAEAVPETGIIASVLANNIYGVDINPASVEITKLALWLHSARPDTPLSSLNHTIRCGNSLVGPDFWADRPGETDAQARERVNAFDWCTTFPEAWNSAGGGGFDAVLGNPPYVKLQNMVRVDADVTAYLQAPRGEATFRSAQSGNTDLYLPFIEQGLRLLAPKGRMAFIAPSLWPLNDYGEGLRRLVRDRRQLERWLDFRAFQIFPDVTTYTALQFFTREPNEVVQVAFAPEGDEEALDVKWDDAALAVPYDDLPADGPWLMATGEDRAVIERLWRDHPRLSDPTLTRGITVGIQTSADDVYHLKRLGTNRYRRTPRNGPPEEVWIEDALMKPLVSGAEAKRYQEPVTNTFLLFPYERAPGGRVALIPAAAMAQRFPLGWRYLQHLEGELRNREHGAFDDDEWFRFGRSQNLDKQDTVKLVVPRIVEHLKVSLDTSGGMHLDNVDVGGVIPARNIDPGFLLGVLNGVVADWVFRIISKPFQNDYRSANKQFIGPVPVPNATPTERAVVADLAGTLQNRHTRRRDLLRDATDRVGVLARNRRNLRWLWPDLPSLDDLVASAPRQLRKALERREWAKARLGALEEGRLAALQAQLEAGGRLIPSFADGELKLFAGGAPVVEKIYLDATEGPLVLAYWRWLILERKWRDAARLTEALCAPPVAAANAAAVQFTERVDALEVEAAAIERDEAGMNELLFALYRLTADERRIVEGHG